MVEIQEYKKNNYNFDKMTVVKIQEGSIYYSIHQARVNHIDS